mgnify:CR=1 FL=1
MTDRPSAIFFHFSYVVKQRIAQNINHVVIHFNTLIRSIGGNQDSRGIVKNCYPAGKIIHHYILVPEQQFTKNFMKEAIMYL